MERLADPRLLLSALLVWSLLFALTTLTSTEWGFAFAYFVQPVSAFIVPVLVALLATRAATAWPGLGAAPVPNRLLALLSYACVVTAYILATAVLARLLEIPWRRSKFGGEQLDLGLSAAFAYGLLAGSVVGVSLLLLRHLPRGSRPWSASAASIAMLAFSSALYLIFGISPLVQWRQ